ncbi:MAG: hypothetical protein B7Z78_04705 [Rhodospirillales bacterium 20-60-12]|nr:MAG: hypothetical protein B7Z78_04705 [Rhodospirillales bacterium 20-60-12]HQT67833.1 FAD-dependent oxidoreductase [Acetobacteraceae bacterium]
MTQDLVLIGGGHSHVEILRRFGQNRPADTRLILLSRDVHTPYSGMLPGLVAGHYKFAEAHIDLAPLCRRADATFIHDEAIGLDPARRLVLCRNGPPLPYDILSINIGSSPRLADMPGAADHGVAVKPIVGFLAWWEDLSARLRAGSAPRRIGVVGAGAGGVEMILAMQYRLRSSLRADSRADDHLTYVLFGQAPQILPGLGASVQRRFTRVLQARGVRVITGTRIIRAGADGLFDDAGRFHPLDDALFVTQAAAPSWLAESGLALDGKGFIAVDPCLQSLSHRGIFAAGDIAAVRSYQRPKSGVFAVRQGPKLAANLRRALQGQPLQPFHPQRGALALISTGDRAAIAARAGLSIEGRLIWRWKDQIDRRFMRRYQVKPPPL